MPAPADDLQTTLLRTARGGLLRASALDEHGIPQSYLQRLCDRGVLEKLDHGLYQLAEREVGEFSSLAEVAIRVPVATVCLLSALQVHGLTTEVPHAVWIMLPGGTKKPRIKHPAIEVVRATGKALEFGIEEHRIDELDVRVTTPAKTVADCFRYRRHVGLEVATSALRDYVSKRAGTVDALIEAARADRIYTVLRPYIEAVV